MKHYLPFLALAPMLFAPADDFSMAGGGGPGDDADDMDPLGLNLDLNDVDTSMPVLMEGLYALIVDKIEVVQNKDQTGNNLKVTYATMADATSLAGNETGDINDIKAGFKLTQFMPLQANPEKPDYKYEKNLARLQDAVTGSKQGNRGKFMPTTYIGRPLMGKVKVQKDEEYGVRNNIANLSVLPQ